MGVRKLSRIADKSAGRWIRSGDPRNLSQTRTLEMHKGAAPAVSSPLNPVADFSTVVTSRKSVRFAPRFDTMLHSRRILAGSGSDKGVVVGWVGRLSWSERIVLRV